MTAQSSVSHLLRRAAAAALKLDASSERDLVERYHGGDHAALGQLIIVNIELAISRARALRGYGLAEVDSVQSGIVGLLEAASRFNIGQEVRFSTYATWWIKATTMELPHQSKLTASTSHAVLQQSSRQWLGRLQSRRPASPPGARTVQQCPAS